MPRGYTLRGRTVAVGMTVALVAGGALVRGGVDVLFLAFAAALAAATLALAPSRRTGESPAFTVLGVGLIGALALTAFQLVPLPAWLVRALSPETGVVLEDALAPLGRWPSWRPLSMDPAATALELARAATFAAVAGGAAMLAASTRRTDQLLRGLALAGAAVAVVYYGAALLGLSPLTEPKVTFVNPNHLAGFLQLAAWPALGFALRARGPERVGWLVAFAFTASGVFLSLSRAGIAAFFVAAGVFAVLRIRASAGRPDGPPLPGPLPPLARGEREVNGAAAVGGPPLPGPLPPLARGERGVDRSARAGGRAVFAAGLAAALGSAAWLAFEPIVAELGTVANESTTEVKLGLWPSAVQIAREFPLTGIGRGAFATVYPAYKSEPARLTFTHVENEWLQLPVELGLVAGVGVIALFAWAFFAAARRRDLSRPLQGALAGAAAVAAQNLFDFGLELPGVAIPFALVLGIASRHMPRVEVRPWVVRAAAGALLLLAATGLALHSARPTHADAERVVAAATADDAIAVAREAIPAHPADYLPHAAVGVKLASERRCAEALPWLTRAMRRNPTAPEPHRAMARCLAEAGQHAFAKREYRLAFSYGDRGALDEAHAFYRASGELLEIAPDTPQGLLAAGLVLRDRPAEAAEAWRRAWESFGDATALASLASAKLALGEKDEALRLARVLQSVAAQRAAGYVQAARALDALGRGDEALAELELGVARLPGNAEVLVPLGSRHLQQRRFSQAKAVFDGIVAKEGPALARKRVLVARALEGQGRYQEALREAQVAREIAPGDLGALEAFARLAALVGRHGEAIEALEVAARDPAVKPGAYDARIAELRAARDEQRIRRAAQGLPPAP